MHWFKQINLLSDFTTIERVSVDGCHNMVRNNSCNGNPMICSNKMKYISLCYRTGYNRKVPYGIRWTVKTADLTCEGTMLGIN